ncbi:MAG TPA: AAA family ATPase, partial [Candidatus Bathyarchaeota archaeon]|nr:AAA family ATPase [Candidatus Bathyarchaeota archaeon]
MKEVQLRVAEARQQRDVGRGIARIDSRVMDEIGVTVGDIIEIEGKRKTAARVWPAYPEDRGLDIIRIDGWIRKNCGASLNDYVKVRKAEAKEASYV